MNLEQAENLPFKHSNETIAHRLLTNPEFTPEQDWFIDYTVGEMKKDGLRGADLLRHMGEFYRITLLTTMIVSGHPLVAETNSNEVRRSLLRGFNKNILNMEDVLFGRGQNDIEVFEGELGNLSTPDIEKKLRILQRLKPLFTETVKPTPVTMRR